MTPGVTQLDTRGIMLVTTKRGSTALTACPRTTSEVDRVADSEDNGEHQQAEWLTCEDCGHRWPAIVTYYQLPTEFPSMNPGTCPECDGAPCD